MSKKRKIKLLNVCRVLSKEYQSGSIKPQFGEIVTGVSFLDSEMRLKYVISFFIEKVYRISLPVRVWTNLAGTPCPEFPSPGESFFCTWMCSQKECQTNLCNCGHRLRSNHGDNDKGTSRVCCCKFLSQKRHSYVGRLSTHQCLNGKMMPKLERGKILKSKSQESGSWQLNSMSKNKNNVKLFLGTRTI